jgi:hypothetical protein
LCLLLAPHLCGWRRKAVSNPGGIGKHLTSRNRDRPSGLAYGLLFLGASEATI